MRPFPTTFPPGTGQGTSVLLGLHWGHSDRALGSVGECWGSCCGQRQGSTMQGALCSDTGRDPSAPRRGRAGSAQPPCTHLRACCCPEPHQIHFLLHAASKDLRCKHSVLKHLTFAQITFTDVFLCVLAFKKIILSVFQAHRTS